MYKLFYSPGACSIAVHILLEELGVPYELEEISVKKGHTQSPEYLAINPKGRVPALQVEGELLTEAPAILMYLALKYPGKSLLPTDQLDYYRCLEWFNWLTSVVHSVGYGQYWRPQRFISDASQHSHISAKGKENILEAYDQIELKLTGRIWSVGNNYSCVDPFLLVFFMWGNLIGIKMQKKYPAWAAHAKRVVERKAVKQVLKDEGLPQWICIKPLSSALSAVAGRAAV